MRLPSWTLPAAALGAAVAVMGSLCVAGLTWVLTRPGPVPEVPPSVSRLPAQVWTTVTSPAAPEVSPPPPRRQAEFISCPIEPAGESYERLKLTDGTSTQTVIALSGHVLLEVSLDEAFEGVIEAEGWLPARAGWAIEDGEAVCSPAVIQREWAGAFVVGVVEDEEGEPIPRARVSGCEAFTLSDALGEFELRIEPGECLVTASWEGGAEGLPTDTVLVDPGPGEEEEVHLVLEAPALVMGRVVNGAGNAEPDAFVRGCDGWARTDSTGWFELATWPTVCTVKAGRRDGAFWTWSQHVEADVREHDVELVLELAEYPTGGMGVTFEVVDRGMSVMELAPSGPARSAGLQVGDVIVGVDGVSLEGMAGGLDPTLTGLFCHLCVLSVTRTAAGVSAPVTKML